MAGPDHTCSAVREWEVGSSSFGRLNHGKMYAKLLNIHRIVNGNKTYGFYLFFTFMLS